jgi:hypothetical protein
MKTKAFPIFAGALLAVSSSAAMATLPFSVSYESEAPGMQTTTATFSTVGVENFNGMPTGTQSFASNFGTAGISGQYNGVMVNNADQYGGAGGTGQYAVTFSDRGYSLDLSSTISGGVNYFGFWLSALDRGNTVSFYTNNRLLFTFNPQDVINAVNATSTPGAYYGNPNSNFRGQNSAEPYIFLNFFNDAGSFDKVVFAENPMSGGYESDNHTVGHFITKGTGTFIPLSPSSFPTVGGVPEPGVWLMMIAGFGLVGFGMRRRASTTAAA